jgi:hypothetical protein
MNYRFLLLFIISSFLCLTLFFTANNVINWKVQGGVDAENIPENYPGDVSLMMVERERYFNLAEITQLPAWFLHQLIQTKINSVYEDNFSKNRMTVPNLIKKRLKFRFVDLNNDEYPEIILNYTGLNECGNKNCPSEIYSIDMQSKQLKLIGSATDSSYYILNSHDKNFEYSDVQYFNQYKVIVDCTYDDGELALLTYSSKQHQYERLALDEKGLNQFNDGCKFVTQENLMIPSTLIKNTLDQYESLH